MLYKDFMKIYCFLVLSFFLTISVQAQFESSKRKVNISAAPDKMSSKKAKIISENVTSIFPSIKFESQYLNKNEDKLLKQISNVPRIGETKEKTTYEVRNSSEIYTDIVKKKLEKDLIQEGIVNDMVSKDIDYGEFIVYTKRINIGCRDYGAIDGDYVSVLLNGEIIIPKLFLDYDFKPFDFNLKEGLNIIEIIALNTGELFPNTGNFLFVDGDNQIITNQQWALNKEYRAIIHIRYIKGRIKDAVLKNNNKKDDN